MNDRLAMLGCLLLCVGLAACSDQKQTEAKRQLQAEMTDPASAQYRNLETFPGDVVCGEVNTKNLTGGYVGFRSFIFNAFADGKIVMREIGSFDWRGLCTQSYEERAKWTIKYVKADEKICKSREVREDARAMSCKEAEDLKARFLKQ